MSFAYYAYNVWTILCEKSDIRRSLVGWGLRFTGLYTTDAIPALFTGNHGVR